jgi:hypothetical protein
MQNMQNKQIVGNLNQVANVLTANNIALYTFDHNAFYDIRAGYRNFEDFKTDLKDQAIWFNDRNGLDYVVIFESEKVMQAPYFKISHLRKMKKADLFAMCEKLDDHGLYDIEDETKDTLIDRLKNISNEDYYNKHYEKGSYNALDYDFSVSGYSQGDLFKVKLVGKVESYITSDYLQNLVYDTPIYCSVSVSLNGEELEDLPLWDCEGFAEYDYWDKDKAIKMYKALTEGKEYQSLLLEYLEDSFPDNLEHV